MGIGVGAPVRMAALTTMVPHVEPHLSVDPSNPRRLLVAVMTFPPPAYAPRVAAQVSTDAGATWQSSMLPMPESPGNPWPALFDPWTAITAEGTLLVSGLLMTERGGEIHVWTSQDGGRSWRTGSALPRGPGGSYDHPVMLGGGDSDSVPVVIFANQGARSAGRGAFGNALLVSTDKGASFHHGDLVMPNAFNNQNGGAARWSDGSIAALWFEIQNVGTPPLASPRLWLTEVATLRPVRSVTRLVTEGYRGGWPVAAVSAAPGRPDRLIVAWIEAGAAAGSVRRVLITYTDDRGANWAAPRRIPLSDHATGSPGMAVAPDGVVAVSWSRREGRCHRLMATVARADSLRFAAPVAVSQPSCIPEASNGPNRIPLPGGSTVADRWPSGGDYHGFVATGPSRFVIVWVDATSGVLQPYSTQVNVSRHGQR